MNKDGQGSVNLRGKRIVIRVLFWLLLFVFIVTGIWWTLYLPYDEEALYRAIPPDSVVVSEHDNLSIRWKAFLRNKTIRNLLFSIDGVNVNPDALINDKGADWLFSHFAMRKTLFAFVPGLGSGNKPALIFSSWAGGNIQYLKRGFVARQIRELKKHSFKNGDVIWTVSARYLHSGGMSLSVAVYDGVLLGCFSDDPQAVRYLLGRMRGRIAKPFNPFNNRMVGFSGKYMTDKVWVSKWLSKSYSGYNDIFAGIYNLTADDISAGIYLENSDSIMPASSMTDINMPLVFKDISSILKVRPDLLCVSGLQNLKRIDDFPVVDSFVQAVKPYVSGIESNAPVFMALFGGSVSGRIMGLRVPTLLVGMRVNNPDIVMKNINNIMDKINYSTGVGVIPNRMTIAGKNVVGINSTRGGIYNSISVEQRPAIGVSGKWLFIAGNAKAFGNIVAVSPRKSITTVLWPVWLSAGNNGKSVFYVWADPRMAGQSIRNMLGIWSLALSVGHDPNKKEKKRNIKQVSNIIAMLQGVGDSTVWLRKVGHGIILDVHFRNKGE